MLMFQLTLFACLAAVVTGVTVAGNSSLGASFSGDGGPATLGSLNNPIGVAVDAGGSVYVADYNNNVVRKVDAKTGFLSSLVGNYSLGSGYTGDAVSAAATQLNGPLGVAVDTVNGDLYVADCNNHVIRKVEKATGLVYTVAGNFSLGAGYSGDGGLATLSQLNYPHAVAVDNSQNLYIADSTNNVIRKVNQTTGMIYTIAGTHLSYGGTTVSGDGGLAINAQLSGPLGLAVHEKAGTLVVYIADTGNNCIRKVDATGTIMTVAGIFGPTGDFSGDGGLATSAQLNNPFGIAVDDSANLYIADVANSVIRAVDSKTNIIFTIAGNHTLGAGSGVQLSSPSGVAVDGFGNLYIADTGNNVIKKVNAIPGTPYSSSMTPFSSSMTPASSSVTSYSSSAIPFSSSQTPTSSSDVPVSSSLVPFSSSKFPPSSSATPTSSSTTPASSSPLRTSSSQTPRVSSSTPISSSLTRTSSSQTLASSSRKPISSSATMSSSFDSSSVSFSSSSSSSSSASLFPPFCSSLLSLTTVDGVSVSVFPFTVSPTTFSDACFDVNNNSSNNNPALIIPPFVARSVVYACLVSALAPNLTHFSSSSSSSSSSSPSSSSSLSSSSSSCQVDLSVSSAVLYCDVNFEWFQYQLIDDCPQSSSASSSSSSSTTTTAVNELQANSQEYVFVASFAVSNINALPPLFPPSSSSSSSSSLSAFSTIIQYMLYVLHLSSSLLDSPPFMVTLSPYLTPTTITTTTTTSSSTRTMMRQMSSTNTNANASVLTKVTITFSQSSSSFQLFTNLQGQLSHNNSLLYATPLGAVIVPHSTSFSYTFVNFLVDLTDLSPFVVFLIGAVLLLIMIIFHLVHLRYYPLSSSFAACKSLISLLNAICCIGYLLAVSNYAQEAASASISASSSSSSTAATATTTTSVAHDAMLTDLSLYASVTAAITLLMNVSVVVYVVSTEYAASSSPASSDGSHFNIYIRHHRVLLFFASLIGFVDPSNLLLISTRLFYLSSFSASLSSSSTSLLHFLSCLSGLWLSVSTLLISVYIALTLSKPNVWTIVMMLLAAVNVLFKCARVYVWKRRREEEERERRDMMMKRELDKKKKKKERNREHEHGVTLTVLDDHANGRLKLDENPLQTHMHDHDHDHVRIHFDANIIPNPNKE